MKFLIKWAVVSYYLKKYKKLIILALIGLLALFLISYLHDDFVRLLTERQQVREEDSTTLLYSFLIKWSLILSIIFGYIWYVKSKLSKSGITNKQTLNASMATESKFDKETTSDTASEPDPFASIRHKAKLKSEADLLIESKSEPKQK